MLEEVAPGDDECRLLIAQFYLYAIALAQTDVGRLVGGEDEVAVEVLVLDLGYHLADAQREPHFLVSYAGRQSRGDAVYVVFGKRGVNLVFGEHLYFSHACSRRHLLPQCDV